MEYISEPLDGQKLETCSSVCMCKSQKSRQKTHDDWFIIQRATFLWRRPADKEVLYIESRRLKGD